MKKKIGTILKYIILLSAAGALLFFAFRGMNIKQIIQQILNADMFWVGISGLISTIAFVVRAHRWNLLLEPMGYSPSLKNTTYSVLVGYFANFLVPRLGEVTRCGALSKAEGIPFNKLFGSVVIERVIDVISLMICIILAAVIEYKRLGNFFAENIFNPVISKIQRLINSPLLLTAFIILLLILLIAIIYFIRKTKKRGSDSKIAKLMKGFIDGLKSISKLKRPGLFIFQSVFIWALYYLGVYVALFAFPFTGNLGAGAALFLLVAGGIGMSAPVQGGIGAYHLFVSQGLVLYGVAKDNGLAFASMLHGLQLLLVIVFGTASFLLLFSAKKAKQAAIEIQNPTPDQL
ncbi:MAG TPA: lysylphosphatidylglycerol synthase transmembrane domain-containing protein [Chitinophagaceae bacterium]